jgi:hypothetical protein
LLKPIYENPLTEKRPCLGRVAFFVKKRNCLEFFPVSSIFKSLSQALKIATHPDEGVTGGKEEGCSGADDKEKRETNLHSTNKPR